MMIARQMAGCANLSLAAVSLFALATLGPVCGGSPTRADLVIGADTSLKDAGILEKLVEEYRAGHPDVGSVKVTTAGSERLVEIAGRGQVDALITDSPDAEAELIAGGDGVDRRPFMHNLFVVAGPDDDPANVASAQSVAQAFQRIAEKGSTFVRSGGDESAIRARELSIWRDAGIDPSGESWYRESGVDPEEGLQAASEKGAYTLVDGSTLIKLGESVELTSYLEDTAAPNVYSVTLVNPDKHDVNEDAARDFADFLTSPAGQLVIEQFGRDEYGERLFVPGSPSLRPTPSPPP